MTSSKKISGYLYLYNLGSRTSFDKNILEELPKIDFLKVIRNHFGELRENGNHKGVIRDDFKIYFGWNGRLESGIEISYVGQAAVVELIKLGRRQNWAVRHPYQRKRLINLLSLEEEGFENLEDFFQKKMR